ncbi:uncharacterized protein LOC132660078 [Ovis aries]|uniref:uncharacterized protein LOC132660078 n=1 Tax=Ovis aries TaxID=9940 RepID=UPI0029527C94|nr:uncharacterized protein LOC132660078 [Ovis aries]
MVKLEEPRDRGVGSLLGAEGTSGSVWVLLRAALPRLAGLSEFPRWRAPGLSEQKAKPRAGAETRRVASCQARHGALGCLQRAGGWPRSPRSQALPDRPPLPLQAGEVRGARSAPSAPARSGSSGNPAPGRSSRCRAGPSAGAAPSREGAQLRRSGAAAAAPAVGYRAELQPAPRAPGRRHLGPDRRGAGPRHLGASPARRRPANLFRALRKVQTEICPRKGGGGTRNF